MFSPSVHLRCYAYLFVPEYTSALSGSVSLREIDLSSDCRTSYGVDVDDDEEEERNDTAINGPIKSVPVSASYSLPSESKQSQEFTLGNSCMGLFIVCHCIPSNAFPSVLYPASCYSCLL